MFVDGNVVLKSDERSEGRLGLVNRCWWWVELKGSKTLKRRWLDEIDDEVDEADDDGNDEKWDENIFEDGVGIDAIAVDDEGGPIGRLNKDWVDDGFVPIAVVDDDGGIKGG